MLKKKIIECEALPENIDNGSEYIILQQKPNSYTHGYFKYPCKFIPEIPRWFIKKYIQEGQNILDPFAGSGTTLLESSIHNIKSTGIEISALSALLIKVKTTKLDSDEIDFISGFCQSLNRKIQYCYPKIDNIFHWFDEDNLTKLAIIKANIEPIKSETIRNFLNICFISIIRKCSKADNVSPKPYVSSKIKKQLFDPYIEFDKVLQQYLSSNIELKNINYRNFLSNIIIGDSTKFQLSNSYFGAITSPPYINAFDYVRILRLETLWLDLSNEQELRTIKKHHVGTESLSIKDFDEYAILNDSVLLKNYYDLIKEIDNKRAHIILKFFNDMKNNLKLVHNALLHDKVYAIVIGNSNIRGVEIESWKVLSQIAQNYGFIEELYFSYQIRNHYLRIDRKDKGGKINSDYVLVLRKHDGAKK